MCSTLTLIISDPGEGGPFTPYNQSHGAALEDMLQYEKRLQSTYKSSLLSPHHPALWEAANIRGFDQASP